jgi:ankyrin repeat protein
MRNNQTSFVALMSASSQGQIDEVQYLLTSGVEVNTQDEEGYTALIVAAEYGQANVVQILLANNADIEVKNHHGRTALMFAAQNGHLKSHKFCLLMVQRLKHKIVKVLQPL